MFGQYRIGYAQDVDSGVQDQPGQPDAQAEASETTGLRALFRKPQPDSAAPPQAMPNPPPAAATRLVKQAGQSRPTSRAEPTQPVVSRPIVKPHLRADPRFRIWIIRTTVVAAVYLGFMIWHGWRVGVTAAVVYVTADVIYRSRTTSIVPSGVRVTSAQRSTRRRLRLLRTSGYLALNARSIAGTKHVVDHLVVGPAGIFAMDSQRMDKRLPLRMIGGMLYHGQRSMEKRLDHARFEANMTARLLGAELGRTVRVHPVVVTYGPSSMWKIMQVKGVALFDGSRIRSYFRQQTKRTRGHHLDSGEIAILYDAAGRALPPIR
jgi:hypothetical protein